MGNKAKRYFCVVLLVIFGVNLWGGEHNNVRPRAREAGIAPGVLSPGSLNSITDVEGVKVGHVTLIEGKDIRTGVTAIIPHSGNLFAEKVPAAIIGRDSYLCEALPIERTLEICRKYKVLN